MMMVVDWGPTIVRFLKKKRLKKLIKKLKKKKIKKENVPFAQTCVDQP